MEVIITDTVGFIRNLPADLLQAFMATLEELQEADLLVHVIDVSNPSHQDHIQVVERLLRELDLGDLPVLKVFNKMDRVENPEEVRIEAEREGVVISALDAATLSPFLLEAERLIGKVLHDQGPKRR
jgi:GTP-binding protein HflX